MKIVFNILLFFISYFFVVLIGEIFQYLIEFRKKDETFTLTICENGAAHKKEYVSASAYMKFMCVMWVSVVLQILTTLLTLFVVFFAIAKG